MWVATGTARTTDPGGALWFDRVAPLCEAGPMSNFPSETTPSDAAPWVPMAREPLDAAQAGVLAPMFKALGDPVRLRLLSMIASAGDGEVCVCDLSGAFPLTGPTISHHLRVLREAGLVDCERRGTWVYYRAVPRSLTWLAGMLDVAVPVGAGA